MFVDKKSFQATYVDTGFPQWQCPSCKKGTVQVKQIGEYESEHMRRWMQSDESNFTDWGAEFTGTGECSNDVCKQTIIVTGEISYQYQQYFDNQSGELVDDIYKLCAIRYTNPAPHIIPLDVLANQYKIKQLLEKSFSLFWCDLDACVGKLRLTLERIMDVEKVPDLDQNNKTIMLHNRLTEFSKQRPDLEDYLLAVKWMGNDGIHQGGLNRNDVFDAYDMFSQIIHKLYDDREAKLKAKAAEIIKNKGVS